MFAKKRQNIHWTGGFTLYSRRVIHGCKIKPRLATCDGSDTVLLCHSGAHLMHFDRSLKRIHEHKLSSDIHPQNTTTYALPMPRKPPQAAVEVREQRCGDGSDKLAVDNNTTSSGAAVQLEHTA